MTCKSGKSCKQRNYKKEYNDFHGKPRQIKLRNMRNKARKAHGLKRGDPREVHHKKPVSKGGSNSKHNTVVTSRAYNRKKGNSY